MEQPSQHAEEMAHVQNVEDLVDSINMRRVTRAQPVIHVIDDDMFAHSLLHNAMVGSYAVHNSYSGTQAIEHYAMAAPDIVFLDIGLPDIDGVEVLKKIREMDEHSFVVMLSGLGDRATVLESIKSGSKGFIAKPFNRQKLLSYIKECPSIQFKSNQSNWVYSDKGVVRRDGLKLDNRA